MISWVDLIQSNHTIQSLLGIHGKTERPSPHFLRLPLSLNQDIAPYQDASKKSPCPLTYFSLSTPSTSSQSKSTHITIHLPPLTTIRMKKTIYWQSLKKKRKRNKKNWGKRWINCKSHNKTHSPLHLSLSLFCTQPTFLPFLFFIHSKGIVAQCAWASFVKHVHKWKLAIFTMLHDENGIKEHFPPPPLFFF